MEFAILAARIDGSRQIAEQGGIEVPASVAPIQFLGIDTSDLGLHSALNHVARQLRRGKIPEGKERLQSGSAQLIFPVLTNVLQEQVAESDRLDALPDCPPPDGRDQI